MHEHIVTTVDGLPMSVECYSGLCPEEPQRNTAKCRKCKRPRDNHASDESLCPICIYEERQREANAPVVP